MTLQSKHERRGGPSITRWLVLGLLATLLMVTAASAQQDPNDPGEQDVLTIQGIMLNEGLSVPTNVSVTNDYDVRYLTAVFEFDSPDGGLIRYDSVVWVGRLDNIDVCNDRHAVLVQPQTEEEPGVLAIACYTPHLEPYGSALPAGDDVVFRIFWTALTPGTMTFDTTSFEYNPYFRTYGTSFETSDELAYRPAFQPLSIAATSEQPPVFVEPDSPLEPFLAGQAVQFQVLAESNPVGNTVNVSLMNFTLWDDDSVHPTGTPSYEPSTGWFSWSTSYDDVGIWRALMLATDVTSGAADTLPVMVQVVSGTEYSIDFDLLNRDGGSTAASLDVVHGNFDQDDDLEVVYSTFVTFGVPKSISLYEYNGSSFSETYKEAFGGQLFNHGVIPGYFNADNNLDLTLIVESELHVLLGNGDNTFTDAGSPVDVHGGHTAHTVLTDFNSDAHMDYAELGGTSVALYLGTGAGPFRDGPIIEMTPLPNSDGVSQMFNFCSADFNGDGYDDLAITTTAGLEIHLNDQHGGYNLVNTYPLDYPAVDVQVTGAGSDFNSDGYYDICVLLPQADISWYADATDILIYYGNGDGSFSATDVKTVVGLCTANANGDFNGDGYLDIAYVNYDESYCGIIMGDAAGQFLNEVRVPVNGSNPFRLDCLDIDVDGDLDFAIAGKKIGSNYQWYYLGVNRTDPINFTNAPVRILVSDDASPTLVAPSGGELSSTSNAIPSGELYRRDIDGDASMDAEINVGAIERGRYDLVVTPRQGAVPEQSFSVSYEFDKTERALVTDIAIPEGGYRFPLFTVEQSPIFPPQGGSIQTFRPAFWWGDFFLPPVYKQGSQAVPDLHYEFQLASDPDFDDMLADVEVSGFNYTYPGVIAVDNMETFFWRVRPTGETTWDCGIFVYHALPMTIPKDPADQGSEDGDVQPDGGLDNTGGARADEHPIPSEYQLAQNYPNPFNPSTVLAFGLPEGGEVRLEVYNVLGQLTETVIDEWMPAGYHEVEWTGQGHPSGVYLYRLKVGEFSQTRKMVLLK